MDLLTTVDNPYNPHTEWDEWYAYDTRMGYHTLALLARIARVSDELSDADYDAAVGDAIDEIVRINALGLHKRVAAPTESTSSSS